MKPSGIQHLPEEELNDLPAIEGSIKVPVLIFFGSATLWLVFASFFWLFSSAQLYAPQAWWSLSGVRWLTYGRTYPVFLNSFVYGWASSACIGIGVWLVSRLSGAALKANWILYAAAALWNIGLACGTLCLMAGNTTGKELLEYPSFIAFILFLALVLVSLWVFLTLRNRRGGTIYISQWYLVAAFITFPWAYGTANLLLAPFALAPGVSQASIHWWYIGCLIGLWFTPICLSLAFYVIPKNLSQPLFSYKLASLGFWTLLLFAGWTGETHVLGGPLPAWLITAGTVASVLLLIPAMAVAVNLHGTFNGKFGSLSSDLALRFIAIGAMAYTFYIAEGAFIATRTVGRIAEFTLVTEGHKLLALFGFISMVLFGGFYFIVPRLLHRPFLINLVKGHFWISLYGFCLLFADLNMSGILQGFYLQDAKIPMTASSDVMGPFLLLQSVFVFLVVVANLLFASAMAVAFLLPIRWVERSESVELENADASVSEVTVA
jgi:cytochrome c oxidase cbb3-type subunit I